MGGHIKPLNFSSALLGVSDECAGIKTFRLAVPPEFAFTPGMFIMISFEDAPKISRAYSISSSPFEKGAIEITLNQVGDFTARLFSLKPGQSLTLKGPYGRWLYSDDVKQAALISGGTGITPFRSMARYVLQKGLANKLAIFYSTKTPSDAIYRRELDEFNRSGIKVYHTITRPQLMKPGEKWNGPTGRITADLLAAELPDFLATTFYMCGPVSLVEHLSQGLLSKGIPKKQIRYEKWGDYSF